MYVLDIIARSFYSKKPSEQIVEIQLINDVNIKLTMLQSCIFISWYKIYSLPLEEKMCENKNIPDIDHWTDPK